MAVIACQHVLIVRLGRIHPAWRKLLLDRHTLYHTVHRRSVWRSSASATTEAAVSRSSRASVRSAHPPAAAAATRNRKLSSNWATHHHAHVHTRRHTTLTPCCAVSHQLVQSQRALSRLCFHAFLPCGTSCSMHHLTDTTHASKMLSSNMVMARNAMSCTAEVGPGLIKTIEVFGIPCALQIRSSAVCFKVSAAFRQVGRMRDLVAAYPSPSESDSIACPSGSAVNVDVVATRNL